MKKRFLSILLTLCMVTQLVPTSALATQVTNSSGLSSADVYTVTDDSGLTVYDDSGQDDSGAPSDSDSSNDAVIETGDDSGEVALASATEGTHTHRVCGEKDCTDANHGGELTWTPISSLAQISADGNYYLTDDVTLSTDWYCANNVKLCLNGHNVTKQSNDAVINVLSGKSLAITDCTSNADEVGKITHASGKKGLGIYVLGTGTLDLWNGSITGNSSVWGAGVYNEGTFTMRGGSITDNSATADGGGVYNKGTFTMSGGSIAGNSASDRNGGGVCNCNTGTFTMSGGSITNNSAQSGGGFYGDSAFTMTGGSIAGNSATANGGGVINQGAITVSGSATINDNKVGDKTDNVYLSTGQRITVATGGMGSGASVGITSQNPDSGETIVTGTSATTGFISDDASYELKSNDTSNGLKLVTLAPVEKEHTHHRICVEENCTDEDNHGGEVTWTEWTETNSLPSAAGYYYLTDDVTLSDTWTVNKDVNLCLNGHDIIGPKGKDAIVVNAKVSLTITDCRDGEAVGKITHKNGEEGRGVVVKTNGMSDGKGTFTLWNGSITGNTINTYDDSFGAGVQVSGTFNMYGGTISNNSAYSGAGVGNYGAFNMAGGSITSNTLAGEYGVGGGVHNSGSSTFNVWGSVNITGNKSSDAADGTENNVYLDNSDRTVTVEEGKSLSSESRIGITSSEPQNSHTVVSGSTSKTIFSSDNGYYSLVDNGANGLMLMAQHSHAVCGKTDCSHEGHNNNDVWTAWDRTNSLPTQAGNYYLVYNVELSSTWEVSNDVNLCLNGKTITGASGQDVIKIAEGKNLTITDCKTDAGKITHKSGAKGRGVTVENNGNLTLWNGSITGNSVDGEAGGVYNNGTLTMNGGSITGNYATGNAGGVSNYGTFNLSDGGITNNSATDGEGGGVYNAKDAAFTMSGGSITNNSATGNAGGVSNYGTFNLSDGSIADNTATDNGGGVCNSQDGSFTMTGGSITGNSATTNGGGVINQGAITVSGSVTINDNKVGDETNNVYLSAGQQIAVASGGMSSDASVGVTTQNPDDDPILVPGVSTTTGFFSDDANHELAAVSGGLRLSKVHKHKVCGKTDCDDTHDHGEDLKWVAWTSTNSLPNTPGNYYLDNDVTLTGTWSPRGNTNLCLNGHTITGAEAEDSLPYDAIFIDKGASLSITDCHDGQGVGKVTHDKDVTGAGVEVRQGCTFSLWNGSITGNALANPNSWISGGMGAGVSNLGTFNMHGGSITDNSLAFSGGGVYNSSEGTFNMYGGIIRGNSAKYNGGGVYNYGTFNMTGGSITDNTATGGVLGSGDSGGVYNDGTFNLSGNVTITDNTANKAASNVYITTATVSFPTHPINVIGTMGPDARVGITANKPWQSHTVVTGTGDPTAFFSDNTDYKIAPDAANANLKLVDALDAGHEHKICGDNSCEDSEHGKELYYYAISSLDEINADGNYSLKSDVDLSDTWECNYKVNLCLNGHTITGAKEKDAIKVKSGASLTITDCKQIVGKITHNDSEKGRGVNVAEGGSLTLWNGSITGNTVNTYDNSYGAGVFNNGTLTMYGGSITGNSAYNGAGIFNGTSSTFFMYGGSITGNTATSDGGGVHNLGTITMSGATITGNKAGNLGGGVNSCGQLNLSGNVIIEDNTAGNLPSNVYLYQTAIYTNAKIVVTEPGVGENTSVGITAYGPETSPMVVSGTTNTKGFFSDKVAYALVSDNGNNGLKLVGESTAAHKHKIHGSAECEDASQGNELTWKPIASPADITEDGNYYLTRKVTLSGTWECNYNVNLCLNGYDIIGASSEDTICVAEGKTLTITDCQEDAGKITHKSGELGRGAYVKNNGTLTLWNGSITGNTAPANWSGAGVYNLGTLEMLGGSITGNTATSNGAGVHNLGELKLSGNVTISGNTVNEAENNVYLSTGKKITVTGTAMGQNASVGILVESPDGNPVVVEGTNSLLGFSVNMEDYKLVADAEKNQLKLSETHEHKVCGDESCDDDSHSTLGWKAISSLDEIKANGNYSLKNDVTLDGSWVCKYDVKLCLNGHEIVGANDANTIEVAAYASLTITDCHTGDAVGKITHSSGDLGRGVDVSPFGTFILWNGSITGNTAKANLAGGGVDNFGTFEMHGGSITGNKAPGKGGRGSNGVGGGVENYGKFTMSGGSIANNSADDRGAGVVNFDTFTMSGGSIAQNSAKNGGGVYNANGTVSISGGSITGNTATENGGGVYNLEGRTLNMTGGSITGNTASISAGGVYNDGTFNLSGNVTIKDNKMGDVANNVYLPSGKTVAVAEGGMDNGASVGITAEKPGDGPLVVSGTSDTKGFSSDDTDYRLLATGDGLSLSTAHKHAVCGETACDDTHDHGEDLKWEAWTSTTSLPDQPGNYYLENNVTLTKYSWKSPNNVNLCLNGKTITQSYRENTIEVGYGKSLTITDCRSGQDAGKITHSGTSGIGVNVESGGTLTLWNGAITGNSSAKGAGVYNEGTFTMHGGTITGNSATSWGGGVYNYGSGAFTMSGGVITGNSARLGGGVYNDGTLSLSGDVTIKDNKTTGTDKDNNVYLPSGKTIAVAGTGMGNDATVGIKAETPADGLLVVTGASDTKGFSSDDTDYKLLATGDGLSLSKPHKHAVCGETDCSHEGHDKGDVWTAWDSTTSLPTQAGNYYLTSDVALSSTWECDVNVNLCLNGKTITGASGQDAIKVAEGASLAITDCKTGDAAGKITHKSGEKGRGISNYGKLTLWNGSVTGNSDKTYIGGGGIYNAGSLTMSGGSVAGNSATFGGGGIYNAGSLTMSGGSVAGNSATFGGGGIYNAGSLTMSGGSIAGNSAVFAGGVFCSSSTATFAMTAGSITNNKGGGLYSYAELNLSGAVAIKNNTYADKANNVCLLGGAVIAVAEGGLGEGASVGITAQTPGDSPVVVRGTSNAAGFSSDDVNYELVKGNDGELKLLARTVQISGVKLLVADGGDEMSVGQDGVGSKVYDGAAVAYEAGSYTPDELTDVTLTYTWQVKSGETYTDIADNVAPSDTGSYRLLVSAKRDSALLGTAELPFTIARRGVAITGATVTDKTYDGTVDADVTAVSFDGLVEGESLTPGTDYTVSSAAFNSADVASASKVTFSVKLADTAVAKNYVLTSAEGEQDAKIKKAAAQDHAFSVSGNPGQENTCDVPEGYVVKGGQVTVSVESDASNILDGVPAYDGSTGKLTYKLKSSATVGQTATVKFAVTSGNYEDYTITATLGVTAKEQVEIHVTAGDYTYDGNAHAPADVTVDGEKVPVTELVKTYEGVEGTAYAPSDQAPTAAGKYTVTVSVASDNSQYYGSASCEFEIKPKALTATIKAEKKTYDGSAKATVTPELDDVVENDKGKVTATVKNAMFADKNVGENKGVTAGISLDGDAAGNYTVNATAVTTASITAKEVTISGVTVEGSKTYDKTVAAAITSNGKIDGKIGSDSLEIKAGTASYGDASVGTGKTVTFTDFELAGADAGNYRLKGQPASTTASITAKEVTISGAAVDATKVYDGNADARIANSGELIGVMAGDTVAIKAGTASYGDKTAGQDKTVTFSGFDLEGADAGNYELKAQPADTSAAITQREVTVSGLSAAKAYDGDATAERSEITGTAVLGNTVAGDDVSLDAASMTGTFNSENVDEATTVTVSGLSLAGAVAANYKLPATVTCAGSITKADGTGSVALDGWTYGDAANEPVATSATNGTDGVTYQYKAKDADDGTYSGTVPSAAGDYTVKATFAATRNYNAVVATADFKIAKAGTMTVSGTGYTGVYDGQEHGSAATASVTEGTAVKYSTDGGKTYSDAVPTITDASKVTVKVLATNPNYNDATCEYTLEVTRRPVTFTGNSDKKTYNGSEQTVSGFSTNDGEGTGLLPGQTANVEATASRMLPGTTKGTITAAKDVVIKSGDEVVTGNYDIATEPGAMTINKVESEITVTAASASKTYDGTALADSGFTYTEGVLLDGDVLTAVVEGSATNVGDEGKNTITSYMVTRDDSDVTSAYTFAKSVDGKLTVNAATLTIAAATVAEKTYDGTADANVTAVEFNGLVGDESLAIDTDYAVSGAKYDGANATDEGAATKVTFSVALKDTGIAKNYTLASASGEQAASIKKAAADSRAFSAEGHRGQSNTCEVPADYIVSGGQVTVKVDKDENDILDGVPTYVDGKLTYAFKESAGEDKTATVKLTVASANYEDYAITATLGVTSKEQVKINVSAGEHTYNGQAQGPADIKVQDDKVATSDLVKTYEGVEGTAYGPSTEAPTAAGKYTVIVSVAGDNTKYYGSASCELEIAPKTYYVTTNTASKEYDGEALVGTAKVEGLVSGESATATATTIGPDVTASTPNAVTGDIVWGEGTKESNYTRGDDQLGTLEITKKDASKYNASVSIDGWTYDGQFDAKNTLTSSNNAQGGQATYTYYKKDGNTWASLSAAPVDAGDYKVIATWAATTNYPELSAAKEFSISKAAITVAGSFTTEYTGSEQTKYIYVENGTAGEGVIVSGVVSGETLKLWDCPISGTNVGTYTKDNAGLNGYKWSVAKADGTTDSTGNYNIGVIGSLTITGKSLTNDMVANSPSNSVYDGAAHQWTDIVVKDGETTLTKGTDYTVTYRRGESETDDFTSAGTITVVITGTGNYTGSITKEYQINKARLSVVTQSASKAYDGQALTATGTITGFVNNETAAFSVTGSQTTVGHSTNWYSIDWAGATAKQGNYEISEELGTLTVTESANEVVVTTTGGTWTYDGQPHGATVAVTNLPADYTAQATSNATATDANGDGIAATADNLVIKNTEGVDVTENLKVTYANGTIKIKPAELTVETFSAKKSYDGSALTAGGNISGFVNNETATLVTTGSQTVVGKSSNGYEISWGDNAKASNYTVAHETIGELEVTPNTAAINVVPTGATKVYDGTALEGKDTTATVMGVPSGFTYSYALKGSQTDKGQSFVEVDTFKIFNAAGDDVTSNFGGINTESKGSLSVAARPVTLTSASASKVYDATELTAHTATASATAEGTGMVAGQTFDLEFFGGQTAEGSSYNTFVAKSSSTANVNNYSITYINGTLTVGKQAITPGANPENPDPAYKGIEISVPKNAVYDASEHKWSPEVADKDGGKLVEGTDYEVSYSTADFTNVGAITVTITGKGNYTGTVTKTYEITKAEGSGKVKLDGWTYGEAAKAPQPTSDTNGTGNVSYLYKVKGADDGTYSADVPSAAGDYTVKATFAATANYNEATATADFTIKKKTLTVKNVAVADKAYDGTTAASIKGTPELDGAVEGDDVTLVNGTPAFSSASAGENIPVTFTVFSLTGKAEANYTLVQPSGITGTISRKELTITGATVADKTYDGTTDATVTAVSFDGLVGDESLAFGTDYAVSGAKYDGANASGEGAATKVTFSVKLAETDTAKNYVLKSAAGEQAATIEKAVAGEGLSFAADGKRGQENTCDVPAGYVVNGGQVTVSVDSDASNILDGEPAYADGKLTYALTASATEGQQATVALNVTSANYEDYTITATLGVTAKEQVKIDVAAGNYTYNGQAQAPTDIKVQDDKVAAADLVKTYVGVEGTAYGPSDQAPTAAGKYSVTVSVAGTNLEYAGSGSCTFRIEKKTVGVKGLSVANKVYDGTTAATISGTPAVDGAVEGDDVTLVNGSPAFTSAKVGERVPVTFTAFSLTGKAAGNYELAQPTGVTASIVAYDATGSEYAATTRDWTNQDFTVTAADGWKVALSDAVDADWRDSLTCSDEGEGSLTFYVKNDAQGYISTAVTLGYKIDKTAPAGKVEIGKDAWTEFLEAVTFGLYRNDKQTVTLTGSDALSGVAKVEYLVTERNLAVDQLAGEKFTEYSDAFEIKPDANIIVYARVTDAAGNVAYLRSDGVVLDATAPVISGAQDGRTYCAPVELTVSDANLASVTLNGQAVGEAMALDGEAAAGVTLTVAPAEGAQTVVATDKAGNATTLTLTVNDGHTWGDWVSNGDGTHTRVCKYDASHSETAACHGGEATCAVRAVCDDCGGEYGELDPDNHAALTHVEAREATTEAEGNIEYWYCPACGKYFSDAVAEHEIQKSDTVVPRKDEGKKDDEDSDADDKSDDGADGKKPSSADNADKKTPAKPAVPEAGDATTVALVPAVLGGAAIGASFFSARKKRRE